MVQPLHSRVTSSELRDMYERERERERERSLVQPLHSRVTSSELRDMYEVYNREVRKLGFEPKIVLVV